MASKPLITVRRLKRKPGWVGDGMSVDIQKDITIAELLDAIYFIGCSLRDKCAREKCACEKSKPKLKIKNKILKRKPTLRCQ